MLSAGLHPTHYYCYHSTLWRAPFRYKYQLWSAWRSCGKQNWLIQSISVKTSSTSSTNSAQSCRHSSEERPVKRRMFYSDFMLDRAEHLRKNENEMRRLMESSEARLIPWMDSKCLVQVFEDREEKYVPLVLVPLVKYLPYLDDRIGNVFLGLDPSSKIPYFAGAVKDLSGFEAELKDQHFIWNLLRNLTEHIRKEDAALLAAVHGLMEFHTKHLYCSISGLPLLASNGGHSRDAEKQDNLENRNSTVFPRIDPAVITLVTQGEYCLLGRKPSWRDKNRYSCLSGFLEIGETLEQAVEREVFEESGIRINFDSIQYFGSQSWPFPKSVMIGFKAKSIHPVSSQNGIDRLEGRVTLCAKSEMAETGPAREAALETGITSEEIEEYLGCNLARPVPQPEEMEDVRWFHYSFLKLNLDTGTNESELAIPGTYAIANKIIMSWMEELHQKKTPWLGDLLPDVQIDHGRFKYILIRVEDRSHSKIIVRGIKGKAYHMNILEQTQQEAAIEGFSGKLSPLGGGRIEHDASRGEISIYGYSSAYGTALHDVTALLCKRKYPFYKNISISYEGY